MRYLMILISIGLFIDCGTPKGNRDLTKADCIRNFVRKVGFVKLPYSHNLNLDKEEYKYLIDYKSNDTLFFKSPNNQIIGVLPDTLNYFGILYYSVGDDLYPCLVTFNKNGEKIDDQKISNGLCAGCGCECDSCSDITTITKDLKINSHFFLKSTDCDSIGNKILGTTKYYLSTVDGFIKTSGRIKLNEKVEKEYK